jgi:hypothetical protein
MTETSITLSRRKAGPKQRERCAEVGNYFVRWQALPVCAAP